MSRSISRKTILARLFDAAAEGVYALDKSRRVVYYNPALAARLQVENGALLGQICPSGARPGDQVATMANGLCPPPEVFSGQSVDAWIALWSPQGAIEAVAHFLPFTENDGVHLVLAVVRDEPLQEASVPATLHDEIRRLRVQLGTRYDIEQLVGTSAAIRKARRQAKVAAASAENVLLVGPRGSGREELAKAIHYGTVATDATPIIPLACQFLDGELLQATIVSLLGQETTPASDGVRALLLLDVDQLVEEAQVELLQMMTGTRQLPGVGRRWRVISTARQSLLHADCQIETELAHLLSTIQIDLPPLVDRAEDIPLLAQYLLERCAAQQDKPLIRLEDAALELLIVHSWPGNVDELVSVLSTACRTASGDKIQAVDLPRHMRHVIDAVLHPPAEEKPIDLERLLANVESELIRRSLRKADSNRAQAARLLGLSRTKLLRRIEQLSIEDW